MDLSARHRMALAAFGSLLLLAGAYLFQALGHAPCQMCLWQRWPHFAAIALGIVAFVRPGRAVAMAGAAAVATSGGIGLYHTGVERGWWAGPSACSGGGDGVAGMSGADLLSTDLAGRVVMCDEVSWAFAGLSMATWNAVLSFALAALWASAIGGRTWRR